ncbi:AAA family ATPase [Sphingomonas sp. G-3-2-10]|uniref:AAA family ATPase n=1 Tax=Sphingomonas sp. G-3-2-10 TaxID=2728838 RepID=UPI00146EB328|nr:AAA family ATPase [Sphingomonas sp. G-3-2-10]NML06735.1 ATP-binding protein [Sphingomonas sp. G-3-2-10]
MIRSLAMPASTIGENPLQFPLPSEGGLGTVTVLCGPNGSGKSFILRMLKDLLGGKSAAGFNKGHGWTANLTAKVTSHRPHHHKVQMTSLGMLAGTRAGKAIADNDHDLQVQIVIFGLLIQALGLPEDFDHARWGIDPAYRQTVVAAIGPEEEERLYWLGGDLPEFAKLFEDMFDCRLGVRRAKDGIELLIGWGSGVTAPFANWSDGQKSYFTVLATTLALKPEVYIFDEVENFMHPELISRTIEYLKRNCRQTILSSHHPHLIFGRAVDAVFYVEALPSPRPMFAAQALKYQKQPSAPRRITRLETDRAKLASAYRLFDVTDAALLATAALVRESVDLHLNEAVRTLFGCDPAPSNRRVYMDRQTEEIASFIASFAPVCGVVLDWGAGLGRTLAELSKRSATTSREPVSWILYEPVPVTRAALLARSPIDGVSVQVVGTRADLAGVRAGLVLLTNVLHVLDPEAWCDALIDAWSAVSGVENGIVLVTEIYPLLAPERFAIPVPQQWLANLFLALGFKVAVRGFSIHGAESYCLAASAPPDTPLPREAILEIVIAAWEGLKEQYTQTYEGVGPVSSITDQRHLLNAVFGLARVTSCLAKGQTDATVA